MSGESALSCAEVAAPAYRVATPSCSSGWRALRATTTPFRGRATTTAVRAAGGGVSSPLPAKLASHPVTGRAVRKRCLFDAGDLTSCRAKPVVLRCPNKLVYTPHVWGPSIANLPFFRLPGFPGNLLSIWTAEWAHICTTKPLLGPACVIGEPPPLLPTSLCRAAAGKSWCFCAPQVSGEASPPTRRRAMPGTRPCASSWSRCAGAMPAELHCGPKGICLTARVVAAERVHGHLLLVPQPQLRQVRRRALRSPDRSLTWPDWRVCLQRTRAASCRRTGARASPRSLPSWTRCAGSRARSRASTASPRCAALDAGSPSSTAAPSRR